MQVRKKDIQHAEKLGFNYIEIGFAHEEFLKFRLYTKNVGQNNKNDRCGLALRH